MQTKILTFIFLIALTGCTKSGYKSTWDCPIKKGIACGEVEDADDKARLDIILDKGMSPKKVLMGESTRDFKKKPEGKRLIK